MVLDKDGICYCRYTMMMMMMMIVLDIYQFDNDGIC